VHLLVHERYVPPRTPSLIEDSRDVLSASVQAMRQVGRGLLLCSLTLLPWSPPLALPIGLFFRWRRRQVRSRGREAPGAGGIAGPRPPG
jgi:hypothetical protein